MSYLFATSPDIMSEIIFCKYYIRNSARAGFWFGEGDTLGVGLVGGPGQPHPPDAGEFSKICQKFLKKMPKCIIVAYFINPALFFLRLDGSTSFWENIEKVLKMLDENSIEN